MQVTLTWYELRLAAETGIHRQLEALRRGLPDRHGYKGDGWTIHINGAAGELAFAKATNRFWNGSINTFKRGGDVGKLQVRTRSRSDYDLIVRKNDRDEDVFVLVIGTGQQFRVAGWITGVDAKQPEWLQQHGDREPAYFVPQDALLPIEELT